MSNSPLPYYPTNPDNPFAPTRCEKCGHILTIGMFPFCPHAKYGGDVIGDEIDVWVKHGLCHEDGSPRRFRSLSELKREAYAQGYSVGGDTPKVNPIIREERNRRGIKY